MSMMLPAAYGTPHLLGWNATFPTNLEKLLWWTAALGVTVSGCVVFTFGVLLAQVEGVAELLFEETAVGDVTTQVVQVGVMPIAVVAYVAASGYLLVESMRQLFALPPAAFQLAWWANSIPHFT
ncbi:hypothetical protein FOMPIDRAFT_1043550 [Fomitopsis schrenkii]|uniref:Uncharacterized protein n=1 Tax=Fomitopsis schrenkii TaxID=2126942 RepID=S8DWC4_FOMSC|nr:hypothetical protein FOMPIDRAFT_1043550 [Fomitopsis schrenkii]